MTFLNVKSLGFLSLQNYFKDKLNKTTFFKGLHAHGNIPFGKPIIVNPEPKSTVASCNKSYPNLPKHEFKLILNPRTFPVIQPQYRQMVEKMFGGNTMKPKEYTSL